MDTGAQPMPRVAVCVVTFNSAPLIEELVASLIEGTAGAECTLVFADNASSDETLAVVARHAPSARVVQTGSNRGYAAGVNAAVRAAGPQDAYLVLNPDVRLEPGCLRALFDTLSPDVGIAVPRLNDANGRLIWSMRREPSVSRVWADALIGAERIGARSGLGEMVTDPHLYLSARRTDWAEGSTQLVSAACWEQCGEWDESFFLYSEETDFALRARDHGFATRFEPAAVATHLEGGSADSPRQWSLLVANRVRLFARRHGRLATAAFWSGTVLREASRTLLGRATSRAALRDLLRRARLQERRGPEWLAGVDVSDGVLGRRQRAMRRTVVASARRIRGADGQDAAAQPREQEEHAR